MAQLTPPGWSGDGNWFWDGREWQDAISPAVGSGLLPQDYRR